jgi:RecA-family ATPase
VDDTGALSNLQTLARALGGEVSGGQVLAPGPGHTAVDRSLSVKLDFSAREGFVVNSFSSDDPLVCRDYVRKKVGLPAFKPNGSNHHRAAADVIARAVMAASAAQYRNDRPIGRIVATYDYTDAAGVLLYQVLRLEPKSFRLRRPNGSGDWTWKLEQRRVPYRWPDLLKYPDGTVFFCEGEKDADRVAGLGYCATTVAAGKWTEECVTALAGRDVIILEDNDNAGRAKALATAHALHTTAKTIRIVSLPNLPDKGDVSDWLDADPRRAEHLADVCFDVQVWTPDDAANLAAPEITARDTGTETSVESGATSEPPLPFINVAAWDGTATPEREWVVQDRVPLKNVTLLSGEGGVGKSVISLHLAVATVLGRDWLNALPTQGPALVLCCEDDADELHRRLDRIVEHYTVTFGATYRDLNELHLLSLAGLDAVLAAPDRRGLVRPTKLFERIREAACDIRPKLIVLDNSADVFAGNENDRAQVRQFATLLRDMAISANAGLLLTSHPSLTGISTGTGLSGSTAWNASVRSRLYFKRATTEKDEEPDPELRVLEVMKSNYGPVGETVTVRWEGGLFLPVTSVSSLEKLAAQQKAEQLFLALLDRFTRQGRNTCEKPSAPTYAPTLFARESEAREAGVRKADFEGAMSKLFAAEKICLERYGSPSRATSRLVRK